MAGTAERVLALKLISDVGDINKQMKGVQGRFKSMSQSAKSWTKAFAGGAVIGGIEAIGDALGTAFNDLKTQDRLLKQTQQVIKTTGGAAKISARGVVALSSALEDMSGIDQEVIQAAENMLLTFTQIKGGVFKDATKVVLDMSVAMGGGPNGLKTASIQVGKALNDPIKGIGALSKVGVTFTEKQKKVIAQLVKTGDIAGAQKVILKELNKEFGGSAKAFGSSLEGRIAKINQKLGAISQTIVAAALPAFTDLVSIIDDFAGGDIEKGVARIQKALFGPKLNNAPWLKDAPRVGGGLVDALKGAGKQLADAGLDIGKKLLDGIRSADWGKVLGDFLKGLQDNEQVIGGIAALAVALRVGFTATMFAASVVSGAMAAMFGAPAFLVGGVVHLAVIAVAKSLRLAITGTMFVASKFADALSGALSVAGASKGAISAASGLGTMIGKKVLGGIIGALLLADIINAIADKLGLPQTYTGPKTLNPDGSRPSVSTGGHGGNRSTGGFASGTSNAPRGWAWVGEHGKELMNFRGGEQVMSHRASMAAAGGGGSVVINFNGLVTDPVATGRAIDKVLREYRKRSGGL